MTFRRKPYGVFLTMNQSSPRDDDGECVMTFEWALRDVARGRQLT